MNSYVLGLQDIDETHAAIVGGKATGLARLSRVEGVRVPAGFCVTTHAFQRVLHESQLYDDPDAIQHSEQLRASIEAIAVPDDVAHEVVRALVSLGEHAAYAVRSSATAEDLPTASFAGQHDSYLNVVGANAILHRVAQCWASLFTERAVAYRLRNGFDHRKVQMAVVVQRMVFPQAAGILFTADPITGNRKVACVDANFGLGESLVSGVTNADSYKVKDGVVVARTIAAKSLTIEAANAGGTETKAVDPARQEQPSLTDVQAVRLVEIGRRIEADFGQPQDIEWCLADGDFQIVQSRPITTLFPIPVAGDSANHVYVSVGHQQMMTDPLKPLGLSVWQLTTPRPMAEAGGRLFVDVTSILASPASRDGLLTTLGNSDPLVRQSLQSVLDRGDFIASIPDSGPAWTPPGSDAATPIATDAAIVTELIERSQASIAATRREIESKSGLELLEFIRADIGQRKRERFDPRSLQVVMAGMEAAWWLNEKLNEWIGEKNAADTLTQSVHGNVTSEMGLALLDVSDAIRSYPEVIAFLQRVQREHSLDGQFLDALTEIDGGHEARRAIEAWLHKYGMRGVGEIDITRPRWSEQPGALVPLILGNIRNFEPGEGQRRFERGRQDAWSKEADVLQRLRALPDGAQKADETKRMIDRVRTFAGYREYPKYEIVCRYFVYKQALLKEAERLVGAGIIQEAEDIYWLRFEELEEVVRTKEVKAELIRERQEAFRLYHALTPPRVLTSDGEMLNGSYGRDNAPAGALVGLPVSGGAAEGRARVVLDIASADLEPGDILVTRYTDPSWTPLFVAIKGLITEVGGLMTHGAVIAREYGLPAVVGVDGATREIRDGQQIRMHGAEGWVEIIE